MQKTQSRPQSYPQFRRYAIDEALKTYDWFAEMRADQPVSYDERLHLWHVFRYDDANEVITNYADYSSEQRPGTPFYGSFLADTVVSKDPPDHRKLRNLVNLAFTPRALAALSDDITRISQKLLDKVRSTGNIDIAEDVAFPLPAMVIADMLGVPADDWDIFRRWAQGGGDTPSNDPQERGMRMMKMMQEQNTYFKKLLDEKRHKPSEDLISLLSNAEIDGERLSEHELVNFCILLLAAGQETTKNLIANAMYCFSEHPDVMDRLKREPALMPDAIEEVLRYLAPVMNVFRLTNHEVELGGQRIPADQIILPWLASANRDEAQFPKADQFDIQRTPNAHLGFGHGIHYCLGAPLARMEAKIILPMMLEQLVDLQRVADAPIYVRMGLVFVIENLPMTFKPA